MYLFIEKGMRGVFCIAKRCSKANNKYMKSFDNSKLSKYMMYLDANNLYIYEQWVTIFLIVSLNV